MRGPIELAAFAEHLRSLRHSALACLILLFATHALGSNAFAQSDSGAPITQKDVDRAVKTLEQDPQLAPTRTVRTLKWRGDDRETPKRTTWGKWITDLFAWFAQGARVLVWLLIALLVAIIVLYLRRFFQSFGNAKRSTRAPDAPTHVRDLDIRPESLPDDIGAAAWALWQQGEHRNALSLLYRGLLSRLAHVHRVPIKDSSTEGDCLLLARHHLSAERTPYVSAMINVWQRAVYGATPPTDEQIRELCSQFSIALENKSLPEARP